MSFDSEFKSAVAAGQTSDSRTLKLDLSTWKVRPIRIGGVGAVLVDTFSQVAELPNEAGLPEPDTKLMATGDRVADVIAEWQQRAPGTRRAVGGPVPIALTYAQQMGAQTSFIGEVGEDAEGRIIATFLEKHGVEDVTQLSPGESGRAQIWIAPDGKRSNLVSDATLLPVNPNLVPIDFVDSIDLLHIDGREPDAALVMGQHMRQHGKHVYYDVGNWKPHSEGLLSVATVAQFPARSAASCLGCDYAGLDLKTAAIELQRRYGLEMAIVTDGENGIGYSSQRYAPGFTPSHSINTVDTNGAGDTFAGIMSYCIATGEHWTNAIELANVGAGMKCASEGHQRFFSMDDLRAARLNIPTRELANVEFGPEFV